MAKSLSSTPFIRNLSTGISQGISMSTSNEIFKSVNWDNIKEKNPKCMFYLMMNLMVLIFTD